MGGGVSQENIVNQMNQMVADIVTNVALFCSSTDSANQTLSIICEPLLTNPNKVYESNLACKTCIDTQVANALQAYKLQRNVWTSKPAVVSKPIDEDFQNLINAFTTCTTTQCKACNIQNVSQLNVTQSTLNCSAFTDVRNSISQQLISSIDQQLTNNQDLIAPLAEMLGESTYSSLVINIDNRIMSLITDNVISNIEQTISSQQTIQIQGQSENVNGLTQSATVTAAQNYLAQTKLLNSVLTDDQWKTLSTVTNDQNTIDSVGNTVNKAISYISKMISNVVGKVVLFVLILVAVVFVGVCVYIITKVIQKQLKKQHDADIAHLAQASELPAFETF